MENVWIEGWQLAPERIRKIATGMGISEDLPLPEVIIVGEEAEEGLKTGPQLHEAVKDSPSGYFITIPEKMLKEVSGTHCVLGPEIRDDIRHELTHFVEYYEHGGSPGRRDSPYDEAIKEIKAEAKAKVHPLSFLLARIAINLGLDYGLDKEEAFHLVSEAASSLGVSKAVIRRARRLYSEWKE